MVRDSVLRVIHDEALDGPSNMARDEALLLRVGDASFVATLRTYLWSEPTISLGRFQRYADYEALPPPAGRLAVVRRLTGGGAILHDQELTYSLTLPSAHPLASGGMERLYEVVHDTLIELLAWRGIEARRGAAPDGSGAAKGPFFCFARRHRLDVLLGDAKLAGSAQRRTRTGVLQHGSIILGNRYSQQPSAAIRNIMPVRPDDLRNDLADAFAGSASLKGNEGSWTAEELALSARLLPKYAGAVWTRQR